MEFKAYTRSVTIELDGIHVNYLRALLNNNIIENINFIETNKNLTHTEVAYCENTIKLAGEILEKLK